MIAQFALLSAIIILMAFTPLGYVRLGVVEATLLMIPVALGAIRLGPIGGALLGAVFGATSFAQCFGISPFGTMLLSISPVATFVVCMVPRILMGVLVALVYRALSRHRAQQVLYDEESTWIEDEVQHRRPVPHQPNTLALGVAFASSAFINTVLFVVFFLLLFGRTAFVAELAAGRSLLALIATLVGINGIAELAATFLIGTAIGSAVQRAMGPAQFAE